MVQKISEYTTFKLRHDGKYRFCRFYSILPVLSAYTFTKNYYYDQKRKNHAVSLVQWKRR